MIRSFMAAHRLTDVTVVADAAMVSAANQRDIQAAGLFFILGARIPPSGTSSTRGARSIRAWTSRTGGG